MRSALIRIDPFCLFELIGLKHLDAEIVDAGMQDGVLTVCLKGEDDRLPEADYFPECRVIVRTVTAHLEEVSTSNPSHHAEPRFGGDSVDGVVGSLNQEG